MCNVSDTDGESMPKQGCFLAQFIKSRYTKTPAKGVEEPVQDLPHIQCTYPATTRVCSKVKL